VHWQHTRFCNQREKKKKRNFNKRLKAKEWQIARSLEEDKSRTP
jgi:hypothetical protein